jgi:peptidoglycan/LPS O-acetylase OafA/YrhL
MGRSNKMELEGSVQNKNFHVDVMDGLRGIAIIIVVLFHVWQISWLDHTIKLGNFKLDLNFIPVTGFLGVELFFFISAFCLFYPYGKYMLEGARFQTVKQFAYKRAIKILPSYILSIVLILIFFNPGFRSFHDAAWQVITHLLFIHNLFPDTYGSINGVFWSLGVEVQFYIIFPFICYFFRKRPIIVSLTMISISIVYRFVIHNYYYVKLDFLLNQLPGFLDMFACGMLAAYLIVYIRSRIKSYEKLAPFFTLFAVIMFVMIIFMLKWLFDIRYVEGGIKNWQSDNRTFLALLFLFLAVASTASIKKWRVVLANKVFIFMSVISYNLYIWHQLIARELLKWKIPLPGTPDPHNDPKWQLTFTLAAIVSGVIFSALITYSFERPILKKGFRNYFKGFTTQLFKKSAVTLDRHL